MWHEQRRMTHAIESPKMAKSLTDRRYRDSHQNLCNKSFLTHSRLFSSVEILSGVAGRRDFRRLYKINDINN